MCATKLHGAKIDGPAVAGPSFFAIRWRTKLHPETIIKSRSGLFSFVLFFFIKQKCVKSVCVNCCLLAFYQRQPQPAGCLYPRRITERKSTAPLPRGRRFSR